VQDGRAAAAFAHGTFGITDTVTIVAGLRYSEEQKDGGVDNFFWYDSPIVRAALAAQGIPDDGTPRNGLDLIGTVHSPSFTDSIRDNELSGTASVQYAPTGGLMLYAGYHRGYKAGGINLFREAVVTNATTYKPESAESVELGLKSGFWRDRASINVGLFDTDFTDLQINFFSGLDFRTENAGTARTRGVEIETRARISDAIDIQFAATHLDARFVEIANPAISYLVGRDTPKAPSWAAVLSMTYDKSITGNLDLFGRAMLDYTGKHYVGTEVPDERMVGSYTIFDASIGVRSRRSGWELSLWCSNCTDETYRTIYFNTTFQPGTYSAYLNSPRRYGLSLRARFGT
jgi:outer membrane receptor protein involved in Fe transport